MSIVYQKNGNLVIGIHQISWEQFYKEFVYNKQRRKLCEGLIKAIGHFREVKCKVIYVDGSFASTESHPNDFDVCWERDGVDMELLQKKYPVLLEFLPDTSRQKMIYGGEFFPASSFLNFFQKTRDNTRKGIIKLLI